MCHAFFNPEKVYVKNISLENGLSQCVVTDLVIDSKGFLWIGTFDGLNRFDGSNLTVFKHIPNDEHSLPSSKIFKLFADQQGHLWVRTANGLCIFDTRTGKIITPDFLKKNTPIWVCKNDDKSVWVYTKSKSLMLINTSDFSNQVFENKIQLPESFGEMDLYILNSSVYITSASGDILQFDTKNHQYILIKNNLTPGTFYDNSGIDKYGNVYLGSQQADMIFYNTKDGKYYSSAYYSQNIKLLSVKSIKYDATNNILLLGTYGQGLFI